MEKKMIVNTKLSAISYIQVVNDLVAQFFYSDGEYVPHVGMLGAMKIFYENCVSGDMFSDEINENMDGLSITNVLANNDDFIEEYNAALKTNKYCLDFANAYNDAMKIVETKKSSVYHMADILGKILRDVVSELESMFTSDKITELREILAKAPVDKLSAQKFLAEALEDPNYVKKVIEFNRK